MYLFKLRNLIEFLKVIKIFLLKYSQECFKKNSIVKIKVRTFQNEQHAEMFIIKV
jgi:hypothetical protein